MISARTERLTAEIMSNVGYFDQVSSNKCYLIVAYITDLVKAL